jgi:magnesium transporter
MLLVPEILETYLSEMREALEEGRVEDAVERARKLSSTRIAEALAEAPIDVVVGCLTGLPSDRAGRTIGHLPASFAAAVLRDVPPAEAGSLFEHVPPDRAADILAELRKDDAEAILAATGERQRRRLAALRQYPPGTAGGVMTPHFVSIAEGRTAGEVLAALRSAPPEVERTSYVYVVDATGRPTGVVSIKDLVRADPNASLEKFSYPDVIAVHANNTAADAARLLRARRFTMLPVLDDHDALIGIITFDDAMDILAEDVADQIAHVGAASVDESFFTPPLGAVRRRLPWMGVNVFLNLGAVAVITGFEDTITQVAILAAFLPMITDMGGNVGIQSLSVAIRSIALGEVRLRDFWKAVRKELAVGIINGVALGSLFAVIAYMLQGNAWLGIIAGIALCVNVLLAGVVGGTLPFLIKRLGKDPAMMTGPVLTTITDITGVSVYLGLSTVFLAHLLGG